ncbi:putative GTP pyrophosphokinase [Hathewaya proteolytica DSM 3090]|uniref:Putative GTP pyrophosphokinase n=1 Tax=Hathewaya proteolytica DSM 3090 TaxID=1121331 RepID=A0A1M6N936_9CLOT|nr:GTP pyrophosphokinase family protein [Hathewaya proteolytica]SHJ92228.1 putative GTP pyrophosphokinase [Hathewaya proteolytica DSM 3090]
MASKDWKSILMPYEQAVDELKIKFKSIRKEFQKSNQYSPIEFVTGRVKDISSILEKANNFEMPIDRITYEMEDIAGIRVMCQFVDDIERVVDIIRERKDMQIIYEKDYIKNVKNSGYRSYHIIIKYPIYMAEGKKEILAEIQIRTLAMNFWATVEHSLNYKYKHAIPEGVKEKLKAAADAAFKLDTEMMEIKEEIKDAQRLFEVKSDLISDIMDNISELGYLGKHTEVLRYREQLSTLLNEGDIFQLTELLNTTKKLIQIYKLQ